MRGVPGTTPGHGTLARYVAGCHCTPCKAAHARQQKAHTLAREQGYQAFVDPTGTRRRLQALAALGWSGAALAPRLGVSDARVRQLWRVTIPIHTNTRDAVASLYAALEGTPGPSPATRTRAAARGWAPPLAWDDATLDDPTAHPDLGAPARGLDLDEWAFLVRYGATPRAAATRCGVGLNAVERAARRHDRDDILTLLQIASSAA